MKKIIFLSLATILSADVIFKYPVPNDGTEAGLRGYNHKVGTKRHTGLDIRPLINGEHPKIINSNFGKKSKIFNNGSAHGFGNGIIIKYLLNNGTYQYGLYGHMQNTVEDFDYYAQKQFLSNMSGTGYGKLGYTWNQWTTTKQNNPRRYGWLYHLHIEFNKNMGFNEFGYSSTNPDNYGYSNPKDYFNIKKILSVFLKTDIQVSENNFDVYGIANKTIYGYLNINATDIDRVGILARSSGHRRDAENPNTSYIKQKFLAESVSNFTGLYGNSDKYSKGDYLFVPYVNDNGEHRYGYPLKFSFLDEGSFIIDNDKNNVTYDNGASYSEHLSKTNADEQNSVPGYFLTSRLIKVTANNYNDYVKWSVPSTTDGKYHIYAHIPKGATATDTTYIIRTTDGDKTKKINQASATKEDWIDLGTYSLDSDSYVKLTLRNKDNGQWMAFDAIKFEKSDGSFNGTGSVVAPSQTRTIGGDQDIVALQEGSNSMGSFQWYQQKNYCPNLLIKNDDDSNEVDKVLVIRKNWSNSKILSSFETTLPFSLTSNQNNSYDTILIKSLSPLTEKNEIRAICSDNSSYSFRKTITNPNFITENGYIWRGNGSIISDELTGTGIGKTKDIAYKGSGKKSLTIFQWQPSDRCEKLKISGAYYDYDKKRFYRGYGFSGKLSTKTWNSNTYNIDKNPINFPYTLSGVSGAFYMVEIRTEGISSSYPYIYAECTE